MHYASLLLLNENHVEIEFYNHLNEKNVIYEQHLIHDHVMHHTNQHVHDVLLHAKRYHSIEVIVEIELPNEQRSVMMEIH